MLAPSDGILCNSALLNFMVTPKHELKYYINSITYTWIPKRFIQAMKAMYFGNYYLSFTFMDFLHHNGFKKNKAEFELGMGSNTCILLYT